MIKDLQQTFRWFGPNDPVPLHAIRQTGVSGIVTALHHIPTGEVWPIAEILRRKAEIEAHQLKWAVVESVNVHEAIKIAGPLREEMIKNYQTTLRNLAEAGIKTVCYNFMPVLDWTRTHLDYRLPKGVSALLFHKPALTAFDLFILERPEALAEYSEKEQAAAKQYLNSLTDEEKELLINTILAGLPGTDEVFTIAEFREHLHRYKNIGRDELKQNLAYFLQAVVPVAEEVGINLCIHPDDPPFPILGLPRIACTEADLNDIINMCPSPANGITFCTGSLGARLDNDLPGMVERLGSHIHFLHLRNVKVEADGSFFEADHLGGSTNMFMVMKNIIAEQQKRSASGRADVAIPMRPDHGHKIWTDYDFNTYPGYSLIGRLKGLAELKGLEIGIKMMTADN
ncbi:D-mannonate dehydratase [Mucilaginibacter yixingensis]|uniref:Mannonate dehydratase n=1 Tax=Mucilaginibacter yixingensis TaxID=1295612 RepID=A0A2T5JBG6_9SPHI|nr:mannonate dehydratase [Mucilaginibacter yixingensis]PTQ98202.1 D-mannonate dehydratase [Mucilaginibacter yixingensis]